MSREGKTHTGAAASLAQKWTVNKKVKEAFKLVSGLNHFSTPQNSSKQGGKKKKTLAIKTPEKREEGGFKTWSLLS